jgi:hypothetical protein
LPAAAGITFRLQRVPALLTARDNACLAARFVCISRRFAALLLLPMLLLLRT